MIDAHFHVWRLARGDCGWLTPELKPIYRDVTLQDWRLQSRPCGVSAGILVQAAPTEAETLFLLEQADLAPDVLGVVGWTDLLARDAAQAVARLAAHPKLKGLRPMLQDLADPAWMLQPELAPALRAMIECELVFDALVKPAQIEHLLTLARRYPALRMAIDHGAKPAIAHGEFQPWASGMTRLARETRAACKLSGLWTEAGAAAPVSAVSRYANHIIDAFGSDRLIWGSDWPVLQLAGNYAAWHGYARALLPLPAQTAVFETNARTLYRLDF